MKLKPIACGVLLGLVPLSSINTAQAATDDIIWQHNNGQVHYWPMRNGQRLGGVNIHAPVGSEWRLQGVGDVR